MRGREGKGAKERDRDRMREIDIGEREKVLRQVIRKIRLF